jgi:medium-chain acyl-[acyl-carrier-protein] hydrolase
VRGLPDRELTETVRQMNGTPEQVIDSELWPLMLPMIRADFTALETYVYAPEPPLPIPIHVFSGTQDRQVRSDAIASWGEHTAAQFTHEEIAGDHFYVHQAEEQLLPRLRARLEAL